MRNRLMPLSRAIASAVLAGSFAIAGPSLGLAQEPDADGYITGPAYLPPEPDETMLKVICTALLRTEIAEELNVPESSALTEELKGAAFAGEGYECEPEVVACVEGEGDEDCFTVYVEE